VQAPDLVAVRVAIQERVNGMEDLNAVFASVGCEMADAVGFSRITTKDMLVELRTRMTQEEVASKSSLLASLSDHAEFAWIDACLNGLFVAGPVGETMPEGALQTATQAVLARYAEGHRPPDILRSLHLDPEPVEHTALKEGLRFAADVCRDMEMKDCPDGIIAFKSVWLDGLTVAIQARREHQSALA
jgi:hypothetical protein